MLSKASFKLPAIIYNRMFFGSTYLLLSLSSFWIFLVAYYQVSNINELISVPSLIKSSAISTGFLVFYLSNIVPMGLFFLGFILSLNVFFFRKKLANKILTVIVLFLGATSIIYFKFSFFMLSILFVFLFFLDRSDSS